MKNIIYIRIYKLNNIKTLLHIIKNYFHKPLTQAKISNPFQTPINSIQSRHLFIEPSNVEMQ